MSQEKIENGMRKKKGTDMELITIKQSENIVKLVKNNSN